MWARQSPDQPVAGARPGGEDPAHAALSRHGERPALHEHSPPSAPQAVPQGTNRADVTPATPPARSICALATQIASAVRAAPLLQSPKICATNNHLKGLSFYDKASREIRVTNPLNKSTTTVYDDADRSVATVNPLTNRFTTTYDPAGRTIRVTNPLNKSTTSVYDDADRLVASVNALSQPTTFGYDKGSQQVSVRDANGW